MLISNARPYPLTIAATGVEVPAGGQVEVDDVLARSLCEQDDNWQPVPVKKPAKSGKE